MKLLERINKAKGELDCSNEDFVQYIKDHMDYIYDKSEIINLTEEETFKYKYSPERYCYSKKLDTSIAWIIMWINRIDGADSFINITKIRVPSHKLLMLIKNQFNTYINNIKST